MCSSAYCHPPTAHGQTCFSGLLLSELLVHGGVARTPAGASRTDRRGGVRPEASGLQTSRDRTGLDLQALLHQLTGRGTALSTAGDVTARVPVEPTDLVLDGHGR